jgi:SAM-dependent methyltransferase
MTSPYGGEENIVGTLRCEAVSQMYEERFGVDISRCFHEHRKLTFSECSLTGYRYWKPFSVAGDQGFYQQISEAWPLYYRPERWEYPAALAIVRPGHRVLEIGCGRGWFLLRLQQLTAHAVGLETNREAIEETVTKFPTLAVSIPDAAAAHGPFDVIFSFQVLEHIAQPLIILQQCVNALQPGGILVLSTPNRDFFAFERRFDCLDLPPHHMGHYSPKVFQAVANLLKIRLESVVCQPRNDLDIPVSTRTQHRLLWKMFAKVVGISAKLCFRLLGEPAHTMMVVLRKE